MLAVRKLVVIGHVGFYFAHTGLRALDTKLRQYAVLIFEILFYRARKCLMLLIHNTLLMLSLDACKSMVGR